MSTALPLFGSPGVGVGWGGVAWGGSFTCGVTGNLGAWRRRFSRSGCYRWCKSVLEEMGGYHGYQLSRFTRSFSPPLPPRGVEPYDPPTTVLVQRSEPQGVSTVLSSTDFFQSKRNRRVILEQVDSFQLRDKYMFATTTRVSGRGRAGGGAS